MKYEDLDPVLTEWATQNGLHVFTKDRDWETRSIQIVDDSGEVYQLGLFPRDDDVQVSVNCRKNKNFKASYTCRLDDLEKALQTAYQQVLEWIEFYGNTRTPA
jgi:hypothetical protein